MAYTYEPPNGFPMWEDVGNDPSIILSASLTSASNLGGGVIAGAGAGSVTYNDNGILLNATTGLNYAAHASLTAAVKAKLTLGFTMTIWIESGFMEKSYVPGGSGEYPLCVGGTTWALWKQSGGSGGMRIRMGASQSTDGSYTTSVGKGTHTRLDFCYSGGSLTKIYVDYLPLISYSNTIPASPFATFVGVGSTTNQNSPVAHRLKNFMLSTRPIKTCVAQKFSHIAMFGHSFAYYADYPTSAAYAVSGDANAGDGSGAATGVTPLEGGCAPTIHRALTSRGIDLAEGKIRNYGVAGSPVTNIGTQITTATANGKKLKVALIQSGINEVTSSANSFATDYPTWQATWQTQIDALVAAGCTHILIGNVTSPLNDGVHTAAIYQTRTNDANTIIDALIAANPTTCYKVDLFNTLGGHSFSTTDFGSASLHPSAYGHNKMGLAFGSKLISLL